MYLSDIIEPLITEKLKEMCVGKQVMFYDENTRKEKIIKCKDVCLACDDGDCWICFTDKDGEKYSLSGQGIDIYFEIVNE